MHMGMHSHVKKKEEKIKQKVEFVGFFDIWNSGAFTWSDIYKIL